MRLTTSDGRSLDKLTVRQTCSAKLIITPSERPKNGRAEFRRNTACTVIGLRAGGGGVIVLQHNDEKSCRRRFAEHKMLRRCRFLPSPLCARMIEPLNCHQDAEDEPPVVEVIDVVTGFMYDSLYSARRCR